MKTIIKKTLFGVLLLIGVIILAILGTLVYQGKSKPPTGGRYVALGSSFAAGIGLGEREPDSPIICMRSQNGYPKQLARALNLSLVDMSCSGATIKHVWRGGQVFLGPQIEALGPNTQLVTLTAGGNDVSYVGDLTTMAYMHKGSLTGSFFDLQWDGARPAESRAFSQLQSDMTETLKEIARRAPRAKIILVMYPVILPPSGNCQQTGINDDEVAVMREVAMKFAEVQRSAARAANVTLVDMAELSAGHDVCSAEPWVSGAAPVDGAPFHPTLAGAREVAAQVRLILGASRN